MSTTQFLPQILKLANLEQEGSFSELIDIVSQNDYEKFRQYAHDALNPQDIFLALDERASTSRWGLVKAQLFTRFDESGNKSVERIGENTDVILVRLGRKKTYTKCQLLPEKLVHAFDKTQMGKNMMKYLSRACRDTYKRGEKVMLRVEIVKEELKDESGNTILGLTEYEKPEKEKSGVKIFISLVSPGPKDRSYHWTDQEKLLIIGIHEGNHVVLRDGKVRTDECHGFYVKCHRKHFKEEFKARIEYSLLWQGAENEEDRPTPKEHWLINYFRIFEIYERFFYNNPKDDIEKKLVREIKNEVLEKFCLETDSEEKEVNKSKLDYHENEDFLNFLEKNINVESEDVASFEKGKAYAFTLYQEVFEELRDYVEGLSDELKKRHEVFIKSIESVELRQAYKKDHDFDKIP